MDTSFTPMEYLKIGIANYFGEDKLSWSDRIKWFDEHVTKESYMDLAKKADEPCCFIGACEAYFRALDGDKYNKVPISLDATTSVLQFQSVLTHDDYCGRISNVFDTGSRLDAYRIIQGEFTKMFPDMEITVDRQTLKEAVMPFCYGSVTKIRDLFGNNGAKYFGTYMDTTFKFAKLVRGLSDNWQEVKTYGWVMPDNFHVEVPVYNIVSCEEPLTLTSPNGSYEFIYSWSKHEPSKYGRAYAANLVHSVDSLVAREIVTLAHFGGTKEKFLAMLDNDISSSKYVYYNKNTFMVAKLAQLAIDFNFMSARILHFLDNNSVKELQKYPEAVELLRTLISFIPDESFEVQIIHDCFRILPNYGDDIRKLYNYELMCVAKSNMLGCILTKLFTNRDTNQVNIPQELQSFISNDGGWSDERYNEILNSNYALS